MIKEFDLINLDCAHCALIMEKNISKKLGVKASIDFIAQKLIIGSENDLTDEEKNEIQKLIKKVEPDCKVDF